MCKGTTCQHDRDPAVQYIERDYDYMKLVIAPGGGHTMIVDTRETKEYEFEPWHPRTETGEWAPTVGHAQPMYTLKSDEGWSESADWSGRQGPNLPWEEEDTVPYADEHRSEGYVNYLENYFVEHNIPVPDDVAAGALAYREESRRLSEERQARFERQQAERQRQERLRREGLARRQQQRVCDAQSMTFEQWREGYVDDRAEYERLRGIQGMRADHVIYDEVHEYAGQNGLGADRHAISRAFWENASDGIRNSMWATTSMHTALEELQRNLEELERAATQDTQDG